MTKNSVPQGKIRSFRNSDTFKTKFKANETTLGNVFITDLFKVSLDLRMFYTLWPVQKFNVIRLLVQSFYEQR